MRVSTKGRYGLRIMMELALNHGRGPVLVNTIAANQGLPGKYIHVLVGGLKAAGLVRAVRGPNGGLELGRDPSRITPLDVVAALEGRIAAVDCVDDGEACSRRETCVARDVWTDLAQAMEEALSRHTLAELAERQRTLSVAADGYVI
jgi:Rrf2 family protein